MNFTGSCNVSLCVEDTIPISPILYQIGSFDSGLSTRSSTSLICVAWYVSTSSLLTAAMLFRMVACTGATHLACSIVDCPTHATNIIGQPHVLPEDCTAFFHFVTYLDELAVCSRRSLLDILHNNLQVETGSSIETAWPLVEEYNTTTPTSPETGSRATAKPRGLSSITMYSERLNA
jgi:hypothetical protein